MKYDTVVSLSAQTIRNLRIEDQSIGHAKDTLYSMLHFSAMIDGMAVRSVAAGERYIVATRLSALEQSILVSYKRLDALGSSSQSVILGGIIYLISLFYTSHLLCWLGSPSKVFSNFENDLQSLIERVNERIDRTVERDIQEFFEWALHTGSMIIK